MRRFFFLPALILMLWGVSAASVNSVAVVIKLIGDAEILKAGDSQYADLYVGQRLGLGDRLKTGPGGTIFLIFQDDKSQLKIRPSTELFLGGERRDRVVDKHLQIPVGDIWVQLTKSVGDYEIATPTSVASVKGTRFWVSVDDTGVTRVITRKGLVNLRHKITNDQEDIGPDYTGVADTDGIVDSHLTTDEERDEFSVGVLREFRIPFQNDQNDSKTLVIRYYD